MLKMTDQTLVWRPSRIDTLQPGAQVFVRNAQPVFASTPGLAPAGTRMGTVLSVDPTNALIRLDDGKLVRVTPRRSCAWVSETCCSRISDEATRS